MSVVKSNTLQLGQSLTASQNFCWYQPSTPDGTVRLGNGNSGSVTDLVTLTSAGRLGVGTVSPASGSLLDVQSTSAGIRFPNMTTVQKTAITPSAGTVVFDTTLAKLCVYSGSAWQTITSV